MRMMLRWTAPVERGNEAVDDGTLGKTIEGLMDRLRPEAAYFYTEGGERAGMMVFDLAESAQLPTIAEPLFRALDAAVEFVPVLSPEDLRKGLEQA